MLQAGVLFTGAVHHGNPRDVLSLGGSPAHSYVCVYVCVSHTDMPHAVPLYCLLYEQYDLGQIAR